METKLQWFLIICPLKMGGREREKERKRERLGVLQAS